MSFHTLFEGDASKVNKTIRIGEVNTELLLGAGSVIFADNLNFVGPGADVFLEVTLPVTLFKDEIYIAHWQFHVGSTLGTNPVAVNVTYESAGENLEIGLSKHIQTAAAGNFLLVSGFALLPIGVETTGATVEFRATGTAVRIGEVSIAFTRVIS